MALSDGLKTTIDRFLSEVAMLSPEDFAANERFGVANHQTGKAARALIKLGAADFAWIDKRARDAIGPRLSEIRTAGPMVSAGAPLRAITAAQAIVKRDKLTAEQYEAFVGGYRQVGVRVPEHGAAE